jgi:hypothetical protein
LTESLDAQDEYFIELLKRFGKGEGAFVVLSKNRKASLAVDGSVEITKRFSEANC